MTTTIDVSPKQDFWFRLSRTGPLQRIRRWCGTLWTPTLITSPSTFASLTHWGRIGGKASSQMMARGYLSMFRRRTSLCGARRIMEGTSSAHEQATTDARPIGEGRFRSFCARRVC